MTKILFVCLGNICRSPTAHGVFEAMVKERNLNIEIESAGTGGWHVGNPPDSRAVSAAANRGYDLSYICARKVHHNDFDYYDYILAMDHSNLSNLKSMAPPDSHAKIELFLTYANGAQETEVPDPYYGGAECFDHVLDLIENASNGLLRHLEENF